MNKEKSIMQTKSRKFLSALLALLMMAGVIAVAPITASAADGMATIDVSTLGGADIDNSAALATESQWSYNSTNKLLTLSTTGGNFTLTGTNSNLSLRVNGADVNLTLNGVDIARAGDATTYWALEQNNYNLTITLVGSNTLTGGDGTQGGGLMLSWADYVCTITSASGGSLTAKGYNANDVGIRLRFFTSQNLRITGNASVNAVGGANAQAFNYNPSVGCFFVGDNAKLTITNNSVGIEEHIIGKADAATTHKWKLTNATTTDALTNASIVASVAAGATGTVEREVIPVPPAITTASLPGGTVGTAYSQTLAATGDPTIAWTVDSGALPGGLTLSSAGVISGTPTAASTFNFTVKATNGAGNDTKALSIVVAAAPVAPTITTASLPGGTVGTAYSQTLAATGDPTIAWTIDSGVLPGGLTLSSAGVISGTPTAAGTFNFTVKAANGAGNATKALSIVVTTGGGSPVAPTITTTTLPGGTTGTAYSQTLAATGTAPITWTVDSGTLPGGLSLSTAGVISGTPTAAGTFNFTVKAANSAGNATKALSVVIAAAPVAPTITTTSLPGGTVGAAYSQTLAATGDATITWTVDSGTLPGGLTLSTAGVISGTPTAAGTFNFTVKAANGVGNATKALSIVVAAAAKFNVTVSGGTANKATAAAGETVTITAAPTTGFLTGQAFKEWTGAGVTFTNKNSATTTFTMPGSAVTVTANYDTMIRLWGKTTTRQSNFLNWLLCIVCFGWIWMAF
jgi:hypothetical protein